MKVSEQINEGSTTRQLIVNEESTESQRGVNGGPRGMNEKSTERSTRSQLKVNAVNGGVNEESTSSQRGVNNGINNGIK